MDPDRTQIGRSEMNPTPLLLNPSRCKLVEQFHYAETIEAMNRMRKANSRAHFEMQSFQTKERGNCEEPSPSEAPRTSALARWLAEPEQVPYAVENRNGFFIIPRPSRVASHDLNLQVAPTVRFKTTPSIRRRRPGIGAGQSLFWGASANSSRLGRRTTRRTRLGGFCAKV
jgi:hypothetical protein